MIESILLKSIGVIHSEHKCMEETPAQPVFAEECLGTVEVFPEYAAGLQDIEGFSHIYLLFYMDRALPAKLVVMPLLDDVERGVFATRSPYRPNAIGLSIVELLGREQNILAVKGLDILDGSPLLDIKPFTTRFDYRETTGNGWQDALDDDTARKRGLRAYRGTAANPRSVSEPERG
ncbi:MAG: tRNA (N6-threonylcarbamoyladenosine(37)-N6)-methyltransferase TrmO [Actinobacteria bacterium]|nr:tRNA (N6-threonylcarbamoyladenosine(37)-N6)-methyltransferase TrmO [Actinomycetota bacterium]